MENRLSRKESGILYLVVLACSLFFFLVGVYFGSRVSPSRADTGETPPATLGLGQDGQKPELDFYEDLRPGSGGRGNVEGSEVANAATEGTGREKGLQDVTVEEPVPMTLSTEQPVDESKPAVGAASISPAVAETETGEYTVQVGAFRTLEEVNQVVIRLTAKGYSSRIVEPGVDPFYRIWVGRSADQSEIKQLEDQLGRDGFDTYVRSYRESLN